MRSSTGGSSPAATRAASIGASLNRPLIAAPAPVEAPCSASPVANASTGTASSATAASHRHVLAIFAMEVSSTGIIPDLQKRSTAVASEHERAATARFCRALAGPAASQERSRRTIPRGQAWTVPPVRKLALPVEGAPSFLRQLGVGVGEFAFATRFSRLR